MARLRRKKGQCSKAYTSSSLCLSTDFHNFLELGWSLPLRSDLLVQKGEGEERGPFRFTFPGNSSLKEALLRERERERFFFRRFD